MSSVQVIKRSELPEHELVGADHGGAGVCVIFVDLAPGRGPAQHKHPYEEVFITLEGEAAFLVAGDEIAAGPDDVLIVPGDTPHGFTNSGEGRLRMINIHVSPSFTTDWL
jgi:mannose-6-phosphate isomerase-like protein (cupin superfamily)